MSNSPTLKYCIKSTLKSISPCYVTMIVLYLIFMFLNMGASHSSLGSWDAIPMFISIGVAISFKERFHLLLQNGYSRKTLFLNFLACFLFMAVFMAAFEVLLYAVSQPLHIAYDAMYNSLYQLRYLNSSQYVLLDSFLWHGCLYFTIMSIAFLATIAFYRCSKQWKIFLFVILPLTVFLGFPIIDTMVFNGTSLLRFALFFLQIMGLYQQADPYLAIASFLIISSLALFLSYLLLKSTNIQKQ